MLYSTTYYLNNVTITLSTASEIPNPFPQSEPAQIVPQIFPVLMFEKTLHSQLNNCIFYL